MKILVLGGAGFIGSRLVRHLYLTGNDVTVVDNFSSASKRNIKDIKLYADTIYKVNAQNLDSSFLNKYDAIFYLSAISDIKQLESDPISGIVDVDTVRNLIVKCKNNILVFTSSSAVYGETKRKAKETDSLNPQSAYARVKCINEFFLLADDMLGNNNRHLIFRLANIVGPNATHGVVYDFYKKIKSKDRVLRILGDGNQQKSYLEVDACVSIMTKLFQSFLKSKHKNEIYNVGNVDTIKVKDIAKIMLKEMNSKKKIVYDNKHGKLGWKGDVHTTIMDISKLKVLHKATLRSKYAIISTVKEMMQNER